MKIREEPEISRITDVHHDNTLHDDGVRNTSSKRLKKIKADLWFIRI